MKPDQHTLITTPTTVTGDQATMVGDLLTSVSRETLQTRGVFQINAVYPENSGEPEAKYEYEDAVIIIPLFKIELYNENDGWLTVFEGIKNLNLLSNKKEIMLLDADMNQGEFLKVRYTVGKRPYYDDNNLQNGAELESDRKNNSALLTAENEMITITKGNITRINLEIKITEWLNLDSAGNIMVSPKISSAGMVNTGEANPAKPFEVSFNNKTVMISGAAESIGRCVKFSAQQAENTGAADENDIARYRLLPSMVFAKPVKVGLSFNKDDLKPNENIELYYHNEAKKRLIRVIPESIDIETGRLVFNTNHFTEFIIKKTTKLYIDQKNALTFKVNYTALNWLLNTRFAVSNYGLKAADQSLSSVKNMSLIDEFPKKYFKEVKVSTDFVSREIPLNRFGFEFFSAGSSKIGIKVKVKERINLGAARNRITTMPAEKFRDYNV